MTKKRRSAVFLSVMLLLLLTGIIPRVSGVNFSSYEAGTVLSEGSTTGTTLSGGNYRVTTSITFSNTTTGGSGLTIAASATVYIWIDSGVTLTCSGGAGSGTTGGGAGIHVPAGTTLYIAGEGTLVAAGGSAGDGADGLAAGYYTTGATFTGCYGGGGGAGGGGAGSGVGTPGGLGGAGGLGGRYNYDLQGNSATGGSYDGGAGTAGASGALMGTFYLIDKASFIGAGGGAGSGGAGGSYTSGNNDASGGGGGGGGGGSKGSSVGTGGAGGGGGGGGADCQLDGSVCYYGGSGGGGGGAKSGAAGASGATAGTDGTTTAGGSGGSASASSAKVLDGGSGGAPGEANTGGSYYTASTATSSAMVVTATTSSCGTSANTTYPVTYDANGGLNAPASGSKYYGADYTITSDVPTWTGHDFLGWALTTDATSSSYAAGATYATNASLSLHAVWCLSTYTITYDANGGSGAPDAQTKTYGTDLTLSSVSPTWEGHDFLGWGLSAEATASAYASGATYAIEEALSLHAVWRLKTFAVTYEANGGSGAPEAQTKTYGIDLTLSSVSPTWTGHDFLGWALAADATSSVYASGATYATNDTLALHAVWSLSTYTVTYDANGGLNAPASASITYGDAIATSTPERIGHDFLGWALLSDATSALYQAGDAYTTEADATLHAVWACVTYNLTYELDGGTNDAAAPSTHVYDTPSVIPDPSRTGYTFLGWTMDSMSEVTKDFTLAGDAIVADATLYANWRANIYVVHFDATDATGVVPSDMRCTYDESQVLSLGLTREYVIHRHYQDGLKEDDDVTVSWVFLGWVLDGTTYALGEAIINLTDEDAATVTLTASWEACSYTLPAATKIAHAFDGWYADASGVTLLGLAGETIAVTASRDIYCVWTADECLASLDEDAYVAVVASITASPDGSYAVTSKYAGTATYASVEEAMEEASACYKKDVADEAVGGFESGLAEIGTSSIASFALRREELLSSVTKTESGYTFLGATATYATIEEAISAVTVVVETEILEVKENALKDEVAGYLHDCDGTSIVTAISLSSSDIEDVALDDVSSLGGVYDAALASVRLAKCKQTTLNTMTDEINVIYATGRYTEESLSFIYTSYNTWGLAIRNEADAESVSQDYGAWTRDQEELMVKSLSAEGELAGSVTSAVGIHAQACFTLMLRDDIIPVASCPKGYAAYASYDMALSVPNESGDYTVRLTLPASCALVKTYEVTLLAPDGTETTVEAVRDDNGVLTFTVPNLGSVTVLGKKPVALAWMLVPVSLILVLTVVYMIRKRKEVL